MFVFLNLVVQVAASVCIMSRQRVKEACYALFFIIAMQTVGYSILWDPKFLARSLTFFYSKIRKEHFLKNVFQKYGSSRCCTPSIFRNYARSSHNFRWSPFNGRRFKTKGQKNTNLLIRLSITRIENNYKEKL